MTTASAIEACKLSGLACFMLNAADMNLIYLEKGYTKELQGGDSEEGPLREFTECEMNETQEMLSQKIAFQITPEGTLRTEITAPVEMVIIYDRC